MQLTAVLYTKDGTFAVHAAKCPDVETLEWPVIRGRIHLTARSKAQATALIWKAPIVASRRGVTDPAKLTRFASCCEPMMEDSL